MIDLRRVAPLALAATLVAGAAGATTAHRPSLTPAQQRAAKAATSAYRAQVTRAGQQLSAALTAGDLAAARLAFDAVRPQLGDPGASSTGSLPALLWPPAGGAADQRRLEAMAPGLVVILGRTILSPAAIAQVAQRQAAFVARSAPLALSGRSPLEVEDLRASAAAARRAVAAVGPLASSVDRRSARASSRAAARLVAALAPATPSVRAVVSAADVLSVAQGREAWRLTGFGRGALYR